MAMIAGIKTASKWLHKCRRIKLSKRKVKRIRLCYPVLNNTRSWVDFSMAKISAFNVTFTELDSPEFVKSFWCSFDGDAGYHGHLYFGCPLKRARIYRTFSVRVGPLNFAYKNESKRCLWGGSWNGSLNLQPDLSSTRYYPNLTIRARSRTTGTRFCSSRTYTCSRVRLSFKRSAVC